MIWDRIYTEQDAIIAEKLALIAKKLLAYFKESGLVTFEWNGYFAQHKVSDWQFKHPTEKELKEREAEINAWFKDWVLEEKDWPEDITYYSLSNLIRETEEQKTKEANEKWENYLKNKSTKSKLNNINELLKIPVPPPIKAIPTEGIKAASFNDLVKCDPLKLAYFYIQNILNKPELFESEAAKVFFAKHHGVNYSAEHIIENASSKFKTQSLLDYLAFVAELSSGLEGLAPKIAEYDLYNSYIAKIKNSFNQFDEILKLFDDDFFSISLNYFDKEDVLKNPVLIFPGFKIAQKKDLAFKYLQKEDSLIVNGQAYISYKIGMLLIDQNIYGKYGDHDFQYTPMMQGEIPVEEILLFELFSFIKLRLEIIEHILDDTLVNLLTTHNEPKVFNDKIDLLIYLQKYFSNLNEHESKFHYFSLNGIKFPNGIDQDIIECINAIFKKHLLQLQGLIHTALLVPSQYKSIQDIPDPFEDLIKKVDAKEIFIDYPYFEKEKILWPEEKKEELERWFAKLYTQLNMRLIPFMKKEDVHYLIRANFTCYQDDFKPKVLKFDGKSGTLRYFIHQVFIRQGRYGCGKRRYAQFLIQNFDIFAVTTKTKKQFLNLERNIKDVPPKRDEVILIE